MRHVGWLGLVALAVLAADTSVSAQQSRCADCHFANMQESFAHHVNEWDLSAHGRERVGCETCHGGDASTFENFLAHRDIRRPNDPQSPVNHANIPRTCGSCHAGPFVEFQKSRHFALLEEGQDQGPVCTTCHGDAGSNLLSPKALENRCASCHGAGRAVERPAFPESGRLALEGIRAARERLREARRLIDRVSDAARRARLEQAAQQAEVPIVQATQAGHAFVYDDLQERLDTANERLNVLADDLANPGR